MGFLGEEEKQGGEVEGEVQAEGTAWAKSWGQGEMVAWSASCWSGKEVGWEGVWEGPRHKLG